MRILHCSDLHFACPRRIGQLRGKRWAGWLNWMLNRRYAHHHGRWTAFVQAAAADPPDAVVVTGDLAQMGSVPELEAPLLGMEALARSGARVLYVPGNHDRYIRDPEADARVDSLMAEFGGGQVLGPGVHRVRVKGVEFVLLDQAEPRGLLSAGGRMAPEQWRALERFAAAAPRPGAPGGPAVRVVAGHFPLCGPWGVRLPAKRCLEDAGQLRTHLRALRARLYLCGHLHSAYAVDLGFGCELLCAGSLTSHGTFHEIRTDGGEVAWRRDMFPRSAGTAATQEQAS